MMQMQPPPKDVNTHRGHRASKLACRSCIWKVPRQRCQSLQMKSSLWSSSLSIRYMEASNSASSSALTDGCTEAGTSSQSALAALRSASSSFKKLRNSCRRRCLCLLCFWPFVTTKWSLIVVAATQSLVVAAEHHIQSRGTLAVRSNRREALLFCVAVPNGSSRWSAILCSPQWRVSSCGTPAAASIPPQAQGRAVQECRRPSIWGGHIPHYCGGPGFDQLIVSNCQTP